MAIRLARWPRSMAATIAAREPGERRLVRQPAERDDLLDRHREGKVGDLWHDRDRPRASRATCSIGIAGQADRSHLRHQDAGHRAQQRRFAGAVRTDQRHPLPAAMARSRRRMTVRSPYVDGQVGRRRIGGVGHSSYPAARALQHEQEERAPSRAITTPTGTSPTSRAPRCPPPTSRAAPTSAEIGRTRFRGGPTSNRTRWGTTRPDEPDQPADRDGGRRRHRCQASRIARSRPTSMPRWRAAASPSSIPSSGRRAMIRSADAPKSGAATSSRDPGRRRTTQQEREDLAAVPRPTRTSPSSAWPRARSRPRSR